MPRFRCIAMGFPKSGKTGLVVPALEAGFKVALMDWDGNPDPLTTFAADAVSSGRLSIVNLRNTLYRREDGTWSPLGKANARREPKAYLRAGAILDDWPGGWGPAREFGPDTIIMFDSLTGCGDAAVAYGLYLNNRDFTSMRRQDWQTGMRLEDNLIELLVGPERDADHPEGWMCHLFATAHLKVIGPKVMDDGKDDDDNLMSAKHAIAKAEAEMLPTRYYPTALGRALPQEILRRFPASVLVRSDDAGRRVYTKPPPGMPVDIGVPGVLEGKPLAGSLPHATAFLDIMEAVTGYRKPPSSQVNTGEKA